MHTIRPALKTTPERLMAAMVDIVVMSVGRRNFSASKTCRIGRGIHRSKNVHAPMHVVRKFA